MIVFDQATHRVPDVLGQEVGQQFAAPEASRNLMAFARSVGQHVAQGALGWELGQMLEGAPHLGGVEAVLFQVDRTSPPDQLIPFGVG